MTSAVKKAILMVSFGTSYEVTRKITLDAIEEAVKIQFPNYEHRRAYTSPTIMRVLKNRDGILVDNPGEALEKLHKDGFQEVVVQTTHVINGYEYHDLMRMCKKWEQHFEKLALGAPLLSSLEDCQRVVQLIAEQFPSLSETEAVLLMGHGTDHPSFTLYPAMDYMFKAAGHKHFHVGTVEGYPELDHILEGIRPLPYKKLHLMPLMVVAGDHARNDMAGDDEDSWKSILEAAGYEVDIHLKGLGEFPGIHQLYCKHIEDALLKIHSTDKE